MNTFNCLIKTKLLSAYTNKIIIHTWDDIVCLHADLFRITLLGA